MSGLALHLLESTLFAILAAALAFALRHAPARARYWIWLAASIKFLLPFSLLTSIGASLSWQSIPVAQGQVLAIYDSLGQPMAQAKLSVAPAARPSNLLLLALCWVWCCGAIMLLLRWAIRWETLRRALHKSLRISCDFPIPAYSTAHPVEPGIFGIHRPVLLLPAGLESRLSNAQIQSILAHELVHVRRRDNLTAALHMLVEAIFWFHPLVWWIGARLLDERERACDEAVIAAGNNRHDYADSILRVCRWYLESPLECAPGVTGADLKRRIASILRGRPARELNRAAKSMLAAAAALAIAIPVSIGVIAPQLGAQSLFTTPYAGPGFEVASIKPSDPNQRGSGIPPAQDGRFRAINVTTRELLGYAYHTASKVRVAGGPAWLDADRFDVNAKAEGNLPESKIRPMVLKLLQDRFALKFHAEQKPMQAYVLSIAKGGPKFKISDTCKPDPSGKVPCGGFRVQNRRYIGGQQVTAADLAEVLEALIGTPVIDRTGIDGTFDMQLEWTPDERQSAGGDAGLAAPDGEKPGLSTAIQEQLGLKLDLRRQAVDIIVVDAAAKPSAN